MFITNQSLSTSAHRFKSYFLSLLSLYLPPSLSYCNLFISFIYTSCGNAVKFKNVSIEILFGVCLAKLPFILKFIHSFRILCWPKKRKKNATSICQFIPWQDPQMLNDSDLPLSSIELRSMLNLKKQTKKNKKGQEATGGGTRWGAEGI